MYGMPHQFRPESALLKAPRVRRPSLIFLALVTLFLAAPGRGDEAHVTGEVDLPPDASAARDLGPGYVVGDSLGGAELRAYKIDLAEGVYLRLSFAKKDFNLSAALYGPDGRRLAEFVGNRYGSFEAQFVADSAGTYLLAVKSLEGDAEARRVELSVEDMRRATAEDRLAAEAAASYAKAEALRLNWDEPSLRSAISGYAEASRGWISVRRWREASLALRELGETHFILSEYKEALEAYRHSLLLSRKAQAASDEAELLNAIGYVYIYLGENQTALEYCERALTMSKPSGGRAGDAGSRRQEAQALNNIGEVYYSLSDLKKALDYFERARAIWDEEGDRRGLALSHLNSGYAAADMGDLQSADVHYRSALTQWLAVGDPRGEAFARTAIGGVQSFVGEKQSALESHEQAMRLFERMGNRQGEAAARNGVAQVYEDMNQPQPALANYTGALRVYEAIGNRDFTALTLFYIGRVEHSIGEIERALDHYGQSLRLGREVGDRVVEAHALRGIGMAYENLGRPALALAQYVRVLQLYQQIGDRRWQARTLNNIGYLHEAAGERREALRHYEQALALSRAVGERREETLTLYHMARVERDEGRLDAALAHVSSSVALIESQRAKVASELLRTSYFASVHQHYELYIDLLMQMDRLHPGRGYAADALQAAEMSRARSLLETLSEGRVDIRHDVVPELHARELELQQQLDYKLERQVALLNGPHTEEQAAEASAEVAELTNAYQSVLAQIRRESPRYATLTQPRPLRAEDIQAELGDEGTLLLEYFLGERRSYLWAVTNNTVEGYELPGRATLEAATRNVYDLLIARQPVSGELGVSYVSRVADADARYAQEAARLSDMLLGDVAAQLGTKRLLVVCDGALQYLPFDALPGPATAAEDAVAQPLMLEHEVVKLPSASVLAALRGDVVPAAEPPKVLAVVADPVFDDRDPRNGTPSVAVAQVARARGEDEELSRSMRDVSEAEADVVIPRLPSTLREAKAIVGMAPAGESLMVTGFGANRSLVTGGGLGEFRVVHFATHGIFDDKHPELSGIILSLVDEHGNRQNGFLRMHDIYQLRLPADLVVLSACRTGLGRDVSGEGMVSITRGFMYAGARGVVASLWKVDDEATVELMSHFYGAMLRDGLTPAAALQSAKRAMWQQERWRAPYYWAAFFLEGDYRPPPLHVQRDGRRLPFVLAISVLALLLAAAGRWHERRARRQPC